MKTREQLYGKEAAGLLRDISSYHCIRREQVYRLYPDKDKAVMDNLLFYLTCLLYTSYWLFYAGKARNCFVLS